MKYIVKNPEPEAFRLWREQGEESMQINYNKKNADKIWEYLQGDKETKEEGINYYSKPELWEALLIEQGYLCAYCGCRLKIKSMIRIDHVCPKSKNKTLTFDYRNLVAVCQGEDEKGDRHCDNFKGDKDLSIKPTDPDCERFFLHDETGAIKGTKDNEKADVTIKDVLNLNTAFLIEARKTAWKIIKDDIEFYTQEEEFDEMEKRISKVYSKNENGEFNEYCFVELAYVNTLP